MSVVSHRAILAACLAASTACRSELSAVQVYYVPIGAETYMPVTADNIARERMCRFRTRDAAVLGEILASATPLGADARFGTKRIRAKIVEQRDASGDASVLVDNEGVVSREGAYFRLSEGARQKLKKVIEHACQTL